MIALRSTITLHHFIASTILKCLLILFPFSKSSSHSRTKDRITNRPSPPADSRLVTWDGSFSSSFLPIILKTSPHRPTGSSDRCTSPLSPSLILPLSMLHISWTLCCVFLYYFESQSKCMLCQVITLGTQGVTITRCAYYLHETLCLQNTCFSTISPSLDVFGGKNCATKWQENSSHDWFVPCACGHFGGRHTGCFALEREILLQTIYAVHPHWLCN